MNEREVINPIRKQYSFADRVDRWREGVLAPFLDDGLVVEIGSDLAETDCADRRMVIADHKLHTIADYRSALQQWFDLIGDNGYLVVVVPHAFLYERQLELPTPQNTAQRRLYTPGVLMEQVEEALRPNSYRVRYLGDDDSGYDYAELTPGMAGGQSDVVLVLEKIVFPDWTLDIPIKVIATAPNYAFDAPRTRVEMPSDRSLKRVLILKLDHMGDFIMGLPALERARAVFSDAEITLVVGTWNQQMAVASGVANHVIGFDAFPRNSTEEEVDLPGRAALFAQLVSGEYDLAIDLRTDLDTRFLLKKVRAGLRAGIGTRARFPYLDIFLPVDWNRNEPESAREFKFNNHDFISQGPVKRNQFRSISLATSVERFCAIVWGPYFRLQPGRYFFEPWIELHRADSGQLLVDISLDGEAATRRLIPPAEGIRLPFSVEKPDTAFEFHIWTVPDVPSIDLSFFGGRLIREGAASVLHQSEYAALLIDLVEIRLRRTGLLVDVGDSQ